MRGKLTNPTVISRKSFFSQFAFVSDSMKTFSLASLGLLSRSIKLSPKHSRDLVLTNVITQTFLIKKNPSKLSSY